MMTKSKWKFKYNYFFEEGGSRELKVLSRSARITKELIGSTVSITNGLFLVKRLIREEIVGYSFGAFVPTKKIKR